MKVRRLRSAFRTDDPICKGQGEDSLRGGDGANDIDVQSFALSGWSAVRSNLTRQGAEVVFPYGTHRLRIAAVSRRDADDVLGRDSRDHRHRRRSRGAASCRADRRSVGRGRALGRRRGQEREDQGR